MSRVDILKPVYVQYVPPADSIKQGELYISQEFQTAVHKCYCGCGEEVVTPLNPAQWRFSEKDGKVSLYPSIGNWSYQCQSHYFIKDNQILWASAFTEAAIRRVQANDQRAIENYIAAKNAESDRQDGLVDRFFAAVLHGARKVRELLWPKR